MRSAVCEFNKAFWQAEIENLHSREAIIRVNKVYIEVRHATKIC